VLKKMMLAAIVCLLAGTGCAFSQKPQEASAPTAPSVPKAPRQKEPEISRPPVVDKPLAFTEKRSRLMREYSRIHYGTEMETIVPEAVVVHWTASDSQEGVYQFFYAEESPRLSHGTLNVASHYLVGKDGSIWQLTPETALNRHAIGLNWCSIGIENVGGVDGVEDLTQAQLDANIRLISYLHRKYPTITYVLGHYQQDQAMETDLWKENIKGYYHGKIDPGPKFMKGLQEALEKEGLHFL
jgi:N-acetylmuramoyl-L-alanine amidase